MKNKRSQMIMLLCMITLLITSCDTGLTDSKPEEAKSTSSPGFVRTQAHGGSNGQETYYLVSQSDVSDIKVRPRADLDHRWLTALNSAVSSWNSLNSKINFTVVPSNSSDFDVLVFEPAFGLFNANNNYVIAKAVPPASSNIPGQKLELDDDIALNALSVQQRHFTLVHELGHIIGLRHTNWQSLGESSGFGNPTRVPCTPSTDANSIMNGIQGLTTASQLTNQIPSWSGFSNSDKVAAAVLYPPTSFAQPYLDNNGTTYTPTSTIINLSMSNSPDIGAAFIEGKRNNEPWELIKQIPATVYNTSITIPEDFILPPLLDASGTYSFRVKYVVCGSTNLETSYSQPISFIVNVDTCLPGFPCQGGGF